MFKTNPPAEDNIWLYQMRNEENKGIPKNISTHKKRNKQLNVIEKDLFQICEVKLRICSSICGLTIPLIFFFTEESQVLIAQLRDLLTEQCLHTFHFVQYLL